MKLEFEIEQLRVSLHRAEFIQNELDRRVFHLKTLYDVSKDIFSCVDSETILRTFLMMTMGNFGVIEGFILIHDDHPDEPQRLISVGLEAADISAIQQACGELSLKKSANGEQLEVMGPELQRLLPPSIGISFPLQVDGDRCGLLGLGHKLIGEPYSEDDRELIGTLLNNLAVALKNARSFEKIKRLNEDLNARNIALQDALSKLQAALRKVEILESIKANLSKFVPSTVCKMIESSPAGDMLPSKEQDVSVLFLDIEGYTRMCERFAGEELNRLIEQYFSAVMDAIYEHNGDVNETAGDGLMVLFLNEDAMVNAWEAVRTALSIRKKVKVINRSCAELSQPLKINMGINSGSALVGAVRFESYTGSRWTYTARGIVTNVAARLGALATGGGIFISKTTAERVENQCSMTYAGRFKLKNVSNEVEVYSL